MENESPIFRWTSEWARGRKLKLWSARETGSTNLIAKNDTAPATSPWLSDDRALASTPSLYLAAQQTQGRGRGSNTWSTPHEGALLSSWSFSVASVPQPILAPLVGLALFEAATSTWPTLPFNLKAPNDLYLSDKKTAGLLIESVDQGGVIRTVIGLGLNIASSPPEVTTATYLEQHLGRSVSEEEWLRFLDNWSQRLSAAIRDGQEVHLDPDHAHRLKKALNLHPLLKEPILRVDELGQLYSASGIVRWHEL